MSEESAVRVIPHFTVADAQSAIEFYRKAFGAHELYRLTDPDGRRIGHAEIEIGGSVMMLNDEYPDFGARCPDTIGGSPVVFFLEVANADATIERAAQCGATVLRPAADQFHGYRSGMVLDPFGYRWSVSHKVEDVTPATMQSRWEAMTDA